MITPAVQVYPEALPQVSNLWQGLIEDVAASENPPQIPSFSDPASSAVYTQMSEWPGIHEQMTSQRTAAAYQLVSANYNTSGGLAGTEGGNFQAINTLQTGSSAGTVEEA